MRSWSPNIQRQYVFLFLFILTIFISNSQVSQAQTASTVTLTDSTVLGSNARAGLNLGQPSGAYPLFKNYLAFSNPGFEPMIQQQIYQFQAPQNVSTPTSFQWNVNNTQYESYDPNQWAGATFTVIQGSYAKGTSDPALGCTGTVASSTNVSGAGPIFVVNPETNQGSSGCAGNLGVPGQVIVVSTNNNMPNVFPTPSSVWQAGSNGLLGAPSLSGGATISSETTDLCATCGTQSLLFTVPGGGSATLSTGNLLNMGSEKTVILNGAYTVSFWAKSNAATPPILSVSAVPRAGSTCTQTYSGTTSPAITSTWTQYSFTCNFSESATNGGPYPFFISFTVGSVGSAATSLEFDNWSFTRNEDSNPTIYSDAFVSALQAWCQSSNTTGPACTLRYGPSPDSEVMSNWVQPQFQHRPSIEQFTAISKAYSTNKTGIYDFLNLCAYVGVTPVLIFPITMTTTDVQDLVDFLEGSTSTAYGEIRANLGQVTPWVGASGSPFSTIYLEFGNENWNGGFLGHALGYDQSSNNFYEDYALRAKAVFGAARARQSAQGYSQSATKWVIGAQTAGGGDGGAASTALADVVEINGYTAYNVNNVGTSGCLTSGSTNATCPLYGPTLTEPYSNTHDPKSTSGFDQSIATVQKETGCGPSGKAQCQVMVYEENTGTFNASTAGPFTQAVSDSFIQAAFQGVVAADQMGENDAAGVVNQNEYQALQYYFGEGGVNLHMWGAMIDAGGDCSNYNSSTFGGSYCPRPQMLGAQVYNWCKIGPMVQTSWASNPTYNLPANNNGVNAITGVPLLRSFAFAEGNQRCMVIVNADVYSAYTVQFAGTNAPSTGVTTYQFAPAALATANEAAALSSTSTVDAPMCNTTTPNVSVASGYSLPPHSVTAFMWQTGASSGSTTPTAATPTFSPAGGSYTGNQTITISSATAGATIYYTTNGTTPTTSSTVYTGPITISNSITINAIATAPNCNNSAVGSATYTINTVTATPLFSVAPGTYTTAQTVSITDYSANATIYYTTNGTTPTTSSAQYTGPITISSTETIEAIAVVSGFINSAVATAAYTINPILPTPTFSVASGTYTSAQTVSITDTTSGTTVYVAGTSIYYTTNGTTPTASSTLYTGPITVSSTETLEAIAIAPGYTNSQVVSAAYTIHPILPTPTFSVAAGTYTSAQTVSITDTTSGTTVFVAGTAIYYTTDGSTPTTSSTLYSGPIAVSSNETIEAIAVATGYTTSPVATATYAIAPILPAPVFSVAAGSYSSAQTVSITDATAGATIYYTTDGTTPTTSSTLYAGMVTVSSTETIGAIAVASGYTNSPVATAAYVVTTPSAPVSLPTGDVFTITNFASSQSLLNLNGNADINGNNLQLTDGGLYETSSAWYSTPVNVQSFTTNVTFQETNANADGFTFTIQGVSPNAIGAGGAGLGFANLPSSVGLKFYLHSIGNIPQSTGLYIDGAAPYMTTGSINLVPSGVSLTSGDVMTLNLVYNGTTLNMTLTDTVTNVSFTTTFTVNIPANVGGNTAYVGFTGASGGNGANQQILGWSYSN
jgi:Chitobiase/beta-hexosaminidase C-terminal domain/Legume lectin domain